MQAKQAIDSLDPAGWAAVPATDRLHLLEVLRANIDVHKDELGAADAAMKNGLIGEEAISHATGVAATVLPMGGTINACIELYEDIVHGHMPEPLEIRPVAGGEYTDILVFPRSARDRFMNSDRKDYLRVRGTPKQVNPLDKPAGIVAVLGAGNFSSALEMIKALFVDNCAVVHKPHHINAETDKAWAKVMQPLVELGAVAFCDASEGRALTADPRLSKIYFTGGAATAMAIMGATDTPLVSECGGNNPCLIVPGDRPWTDKEIEHQALMIATGNKMNGGAVCGRVQTIVTSANWPQREAFIAALRKAIAEDTPAESSHYPGTDEVAAGFLAAHPEAEVIRPEGGRHKNSDFLFIPGVAEDSYAVENEAFCQVMGEVALDCPAEPEAFLKAATGFCNTRLLGTLAAAILVDDDTLDAHRGAIEQAVTALQYGAIAINHLPPNVWLDPWLIWGGNEKEGDPFVSGKGNFGNIMGLENAEKSVSYVSFMSAGHMINTNRHTFEALMAGMTRYTLHPGWMNLTRLMGSAIAGGFRGKDF